MQGELGVVLGAEQVRVRVRVRLTLALALTLALVTPSAKPDLGAEQVREGGVACDLVLERFEEAERRALRDTGEIWGRCKGDREIQGRYKRDLVLERVRDGRGVSTCGMSGWVMVRKSRPVAGCSA